MILNQVESTAEQVDDIAFGTTKGPTFFGPFTGSVRAMSAAWTMALVDGPPEPMIRPVRSLDDVLFLETGIGDGLLHREIVVGRAIAHEAARAAIDRAFEIDLEAAFDLRAEAHALVGVRVREPERASRSEAITSCVVLPMEQTMPSPVTTTRLMAGRTSSSFAQVLNRLRRRPRRSTKRPTRKSLAS